MAIRRYGLPRGGTNSNHLSALTNFLHAPDETLTSSGGVQSYPTGGRRVPMNRYTKPNENFVTSLPLMAGTQPERKWMFAGSAALWVIAWLKALRKSRQRQLVRC